MNKLNFTCRIVFSTVVLAVMAVLVTFISTNVAMAAEVSDDCCVVVSQLQAVGIPASSVSALPETGDAIMLLVLGLLILMGGALYLIHLSRRSSSSSNLGAHAAHGSNSAKSDTKSLHRKMIIVGVIVVVMAGICFGLFAQRVTAIAEEPAPQTVSVETASFNA
ncbi:MAG: LPXTG cell wall anchor domain-containing protein [Phoenicibacter congonensis]|uniref:LPXTG cell wall anchor domain-containing protein n=1 Tax=Phoenicibacter congonensis TaxID=1944646 RepID=A0AA43U9Y8_9ACTN|nr:LPXTG cell wall anchor domain-containing protein [Phoenicibacter congonensis]